MNQAGADDNVISNTVTTTNGGFNLNGDDSLTVDESGAINTTGVGIEAIQATGNNNTIIIQGSVSTTGHQGYGIALAVSDDNNVTHSGSILTNGTSAYGIYLWDSDDNNVTNSGSISTTGNSVYGIFLNNLSDNNNVNNSGSISTTGDTAFGIYLSGTSDGNNITNSGSISTTGDTALGIYLFGSDQNRMTHSGTISTTGSDADGFYLSASDSNTLNISGSITSVQANAIEFHNTSNNNILNLTTGAFLGGTIDLGTGGNFVNIATSPSHSVIWDFGAASTITNGIQASGSGAYLVDGNMFYSVDPTGFLARADALGDTADMLAGIANSRLGSGAPAAFEQPSGFAYTRDDGSIDTSDARFWADFIASTSQYGATSTTLGYNSYQYGVALGYERDFDIETTFGLMGGYLATRSRADSRFTISQETESRGGYFGIYGARSFANEITLSGSLMAGRSSNESERTFNNNTVIPSFIETATGTYDSTFIAPNISISKDYALDDKTTLTPMLSALYAHQWNGGYSETGSSSNLTVGSSQSSVFEGRAELGLTTQMDAGEKHQGGQITARLGVMARATPNNETPTLSFAGIGTLSTASNDQGTLVAATAGLDFNFNITDNMALTASGDVAVGNNDYFSAQGKLGFKVKF